MFAPSVRHQKDLAMLDVVLILVSIVFFAVSILYTRACDHL